MFKKAGIITSFVAAIALPVAAQAGNWAPITIINHSATESSVVKVGAYGVCSNLILGEAGITRPGATNYVPGDALLALCGSTPTSCVAEVYMNTTADCTGAPAGEVTYSLYSGILSVSSPSGKVQANGAAEIDLS